MELVPGSEQAVKAILGAGRDQVFEATERLDINPNTLPRLPWDALHEVVGPIWPTDIWLAGAGTGSGKTTLLAHIAEALLASRRRIYVLTLEQTPAELRTAMAALALGYHPQQALQNAWDKMGNDSKRILTNELHRQITDLEGRLIFSHATTMAEDDIEPEMLMAQRFNADLVIIDHLSQIDADGYNGIKRFVKTLKRVVNEVQIPVLVAAQLGRGDRDIMRPYRPPTTYDIEGGEVIAQHMSVAIGLYRPTIPMSLDDERSVRRGQAEMKNFLVPEAMGVSLMKHRVRGDQLGAKIQLRYRHGRITDPLGVDPEGGARYGL